MRRWSRWSRWVGGALGVGFGYLAYVYLTLPDVRPLATVNPETTAFIELRRDEAHDQGKSFNLRRRWVPYARISTHLKRAVIVAEDSAFFEHEGLDYEQIRESIELSLEEGAAMRGASTITQQLAKNLYLSPSRNPVRKLREAADHAAPRGGAQQAAHLRDLPELDRMGRRHLRLRGGGAGLLHQGRGRPGAR